MGAYATYMASIFLFHTLQDKGSLNSANFIASGAYFRSLKKHLNGAEISLEPTHTLAATFIFKPLPLDQEKRFLNVLILA